MRLAGLAEDTPTYLLSLSRNEESLPGQFSDALFLPHIISSLTSLSCSLFLLKRAQCDFVSPSAFLSDPIVGSPHCHILRPSNLPHPV